MQFYIDSELAEFKGGKQPSRTARLVAKAFGRGIAALEQAVIWPRGSPIASRYPHDERSTRERARSYAGKHDWHTLIDLGVPAPARLHQTTGNGKQGRKQ